MTSTLALATFLVSAQTLPPPVNPPRVTQGQFKRLFTAKRIVIVDTRYPGAFRAGHIPGAVSLPMEGSPWLPEYEKTVDVLKAAKKPVVVYCGCAGESTSSHLATMLSERGVRDVRVLVGGWVDWFNGGNPVARGGK